MKNKLKCSECGEYFDFDSHEHICKMTTKKGTLSEKEIKVADECYPNPVFLSKDVKHAIGEFLKELKEEHKRLLQDKSSKKLSERRRELTGHSTIPDLYDLKIKDLIKEVDKLALEKFGEEIVNGK